MSLASGHMPASRARSEGRTAALSAGVGSPQRFWLAFIPHVGLFAMMVVCSALGLHALAREVDRSDASRAAEAVLAAFNYQYSRIEAVTLNNAVYTEAARAVGGEVVDKDWAYQNWAVSPVGLPGYHGVFLVDRDGRPLVGTRAGLPLDDAELDALARLTEPVWRTLPPHGEVSARGLVQGATGPVMVAAANVVPEAQHRTADFMVPERRRFVLVRPVDELVLETMNETIGGENLRLGPPSAGENSVGFTTLDGSAFSLSWRPRSPGQDAMRRTLLQIAPVFGLATLLLAYATWASITSHRALRRMAVTDGLTGLPNRAAFLAALDARVAAGQPVALGLVDLDGFKLINDNHGHLAGDDLLVAFAEVLVAAAGDRSEVWRLGGDEFAVLSPGLEEAEALGARLCTALAAPLVVGSLLLHIGASIGIAVARPGMTPRDLLAAADSKLYRTKGDRRGVPRPAPHPVPAG